MKKLIFVVSFIVAVACSSDQDKAEEVVTQINLSVDRSVKEPQKYLLMKGMPLEGGPEITRHPDNFLISKIDFNKEGAFYLYQPKSDFSGSQEVEITTSLSNGAEIYKKEILRLKIEVAE